MEDKKVQAEKFISSNEKLNRKVSEVGSRPRIRIQSENRAFSRDESEDATKKVERWLSSSSVDFKHNLRQRTNEKKIYNNNQVLTRSHSRDLPPIEKNIKLEKKLSMNLVGKPSGPSLIRTESKFSHEEFNFGIKSSESFRYPEVGAHKGSTEAIKTVMENIETHQIKINIEKEDEYKLDTIVPSTSKENEKNSNSNIFPTSTTDKDSKELLKQSSSDQNKLALPSKDGGSTNSTVGSAKKHILQNWLQDYRKLASKSPSMQKRNKVKYSNDTKTVKNNDITNEESKVGIKKKRKLSKKEIEFRRQKSKSYQRKIVALSIAIVVVVVSILAMTIGLVLKYFVFNTTPSNIPQSCINSCQGAYNVTFLNGICTCYDINECLSSFLNNCTSPNQICINTIGSYNCSCNIGYKFDNITRTCVDINECDFNVCNPSVTTGCNNTAGSYVSI
jgi:hypothetical protein